MLVKRVGSKGLAFCVGPAHPVGITYDSGSSQEVVGMLDKRGKTKGLMPFPTLILSGESLKDSPLSRNTQLVFACLNRQLVSPATPSHE